MLSQGILLCLSFFFFLLSTFEPRHRCNNTASHNTLMPQRANKDEEKLMRLIRKKEGKEHRQEVGAKEEAASEKQ